MSESITHLSFDSAIFNKPCYRIKTENLSKIKYALKKFQNLPNIFIDAKIEASKKDIDNSLQKFGFHKVCMQIQLILPIENYKNFEDPKLIKTQILLSHSEITKHRNNFKYDRFSLDPRIHKRDRDALYSTWIQNSLSNPDINKAFFEGSFISFKKEKELLKLDLSSVLEHGKGIGTMLLRDIQNYAIKNGFKKISVLTETENINAVHFYIRNGFKLENFYSCFHYIT